MLQVLNGRASPSGESCQADDDQAKSNGRSSPKANGETQDSISNNNQVREQNAAFLKRPESRSQQILRF